MTPFAMIVCFALLVTAAYFILLLSAEAFVWLVNRVARHVEERRAYPFTASTIR